MDLTSDNLLFDWDHDVTAQPEAKFIAENPTHRDLWFLKGDRTRSWELKMISKQKRILRKYEEYLIHLIMDRDSKSPRCCVMWSYMSRSSKNLK
jgi:hypothetical protein